MALPARALLASLALVCLTLLPSAAAAQPSFGATFAPNTVGLGSHAKLDFVITNGSGAPVTDVAFTNVLPANLLLGPAPENGCDGTLTAPAGGTTIALSGGRVGAGQSCVVSVWVNGAGPGLAMNVTGDLTSSAGNSGTATDDLDVLGNRPSISMAVLDPVVLWGGETTLNIAIDNPHSTASFNGTFGLALPAGFSWTTPNDVATDCQGSLGNVVDGGTSLDLFGHFLTAGTGCTISGTVQAPQNTGQALFATTNYTSGLGSSGHAITGIETVSDDVLLDLEVVDDPAVPGSAATVRVHLLNRDRFDTLTDGTFSLDLDAALTGLVAQNLPVDPCGAGSTLSGTSQLTLTGATLPAEGDCTFDLPLVVPPTAAAGRYSLTTSDVSAMRGGAAVDGMAATASLFVGSGLVLTKTFLDDPVAGDGVVQVEYTLTNQGTATATGISFVDPLGAVSEDIAFAPLAAPCGASSQFARVALGQDAFGAALSNGELAPGASCTFVAPWQLPGGIPAGLYPSATLQVSASVAGQVRSANGATDTLEIVAAPRLTLDAPAVVTAGQTIGFEYTLTHGANATADALGVTFSHDIVGQLPGAMVALPAIACGAATLTATAGGFDLAGLDLGPDGTCTFTVDVTLPANLAPGNAAFATSPVSATSAGVAVSSPNASVTINNSVIDLVVDVTPNPLLPGDVAQVEVTVTNNGLLDATNGGFVVDFGDVPGTLGPILTDWCGTGSVLAGSGQELTASGLTLAAGATCSATATLSLDANAAVGEYPYASGQPAWIIDGSFVVQAAASGVVEIADPLSLELTTSPTGVFPDETVVVDIVVRNAQSQSIADVNVALTAASFPSATLGVVTPPSPCGGATVTDLGGLITIYGGNLAANADCTFSVELVLPGTVPLAATHTVEATANAVAGTLFTLPATADVAVRWVEVALGPYPTVAVGDSQLLPVTLTNRDSTLSFADLRWLVDLRPRSRVTTCPRSTSAAPARRWPKTPTR